MEAKVLSEAKVYVGTYAKYNNGSLSGAWLDLSDYSDKEEFYEACPEYCLYRYSASIWKRSDS